MLDLTGKTILITGAAGGIGKEIAKTLYKQGANIALTDINQELLEQLKSELGDRSEFFVANLSSCDEIKKLVDSVIEKFRAIDVLVNNAGITKDTLSLRMTEEQWNSVLNINLTSSFNLTKTVLPYMIKKRWGRIISMASIVGIIGNVGQANYSASKAGLIAMTKSIACEVAGRGITANSIAPGFISTPMTQKLPENLKNAMLERIPLKRMGEPKDIANVVAFLASEESSYITGQTINVNGGMLML